MTARPVSEFSQGRRLAFAVVFMGLCGVLLEGLAWTVLAWSGVGDRQGFSGSGILEPLPDGRVRLRPDLGALTARQAWSPDPGTRPRAVVLGGSTVALIGPRVTDLEERLDAEVILAGVGGFDTGRLLPVLDAMLELEPRVVVLHAGHNEFLGDGLAALEVAQAPWWRVSAIARLAAASAARGAGRRGADALGAGRDDALDGTWDAPTGAPWLDGTPAPVHARRVLARYRVHLEVMVDRVRAAGAVPILSTTPSNLWAVPDPVPADQPRVFAGVAPDHPAAERRASAARARAAGDWIALGEQADAALAAMPWRLQASGLEHGIVRDVAAATGTPLVDTAALLPASEPHGVSGETLFLDHCHLTDAGVRALFDAWTPVVAAQLSGG